MKRQTYVRSQWSSSDYSLYHIAIEIDMKNIDNWWSDDSFDHRKMIVQVRSMILNVSDEKLIWLNMNSACKNKH
jgi:hypothetical protein